MLFGCQIPDCFLAYCPFATCINNTKVKQKTCGTSSCGGGVFGCECVCNPILFHTPFAHHAIHSPATLHTCRTSIYLARAVAGRGAAAMPPCSLSTCLSHVAVGRWQQGEQPWLPHTPVSLLQCCLQFPDLCNCVLVEGSSSSHCFLCLPSYLQYCCLPSSPLAEVAPSPFSSY